MEKNVLAVKWESQQRPMRMKSNDIRQNAADTGLGPLLVFLHGFPLSGGVWRNEIDAFRSRCRVITHDLRGFGDNETHPGATTMEQYAGDLHTLVNRVLREWLDREGLVVAPSE